MRTLSLAWRYLWSRPLGAALNLLLLSLGLASITFVLLLGHQLQRAFERDLSGIDLVVGAKGSPLQLILSGVLHLDVPTGNVPLPAVQALEKHPLVASVIPISLGDSFRGFRIVGTSHAYPAHYQASLAQGKLWQAPMQAVLGASAARALGLQVGSSFVGSHGLGAGGIQVEDAIGQEVAAAAAQFHILGEGGHDRGPVRDVHVVDEGAQLRQQGAEAAHRAGGDRLAGAAGHEAGRGRHPGTGALREHAAAEMTRAARLT